MMQKFEICVACLVFICCINFKVALSQFSYGSQGGFHNSFSYPSLGSSINFQSPNLHHIGSGSSYIDHSDAFKNWPNLNLHSSSSGWDRNTDILRFAPKFNRDDFSSSFPNFNDNKYPFTNLNTQIEIPTAYRSEFNKFTTSRTTKTPKPITTSRTTKKPKSTTTTSQPRIQYASFHSYGRTFDRKWLLQNTYIARNDFHESKSPIGLGPLARALFSSGIRWGYKNDFSIDDRITWDESDDEKWRATTSAPYFENKVPGEDKILPASAVDGAATAFGIVSLLPLIVPATKPLMYCGNTNLKQLPIKISSEIYICKDGKFKITCADNLRQQSGSQHCSIREVKCDFEDEKSNRNIFCMAKTLYSESDIYCDEMTSINDEISVLNCHDGSYPKYLASFIPTTTSKSLNQIATEAPKLSFKAQAHIFLLKLMGKYEVLEKQPTTTTEAYPFASFDAWHPEALTVVPETTTSVTTKNSDLIFEEIITESTSLSSILTTEAPYEWMRLVTNSNNDTMLENLPEELVETAEKTPQSELPKNWMKVLINNQLRKN